MQIKVYTKRFYAMLPLFVLAALSCFAADVLARDTLYVDCQALSGKNNGESWKNAYLGLERALMRANPETDIWIAEGVYRSKAPLSQESSYRIGDQIALFGGFRGANGAFVGEQRLEQRNPDAFHTVLTGEHPRSAHVRRVLQAGDQCVLDGIIVENGRALNGSGIEIKPGATVTVRSCIFRNNQAQSAGAALFAGQRSRVLVEKCTFEENSAGWAGGGCAAYAVAAITIRASGFWRNRAKLGGGIAAVSCAPHVVSSVFYANQADSKGGALYTRGAARGSAMIVNTTAAHNYAAFGGAMYADSCHAADVIRIVNSIFWADSASQHAHELFVGGATVSLAYSTIQGGLGGVVATRSHTGINGGSALFDGGRVNEKNPLFVNTPICWDRTSRNDPQGRVDRVYVTSASRFRPGDIIEINEDGITRCVQEVNNSAIIFDPPLNAACPRETFVENWGGGASREAGHVHAVWDTVVSPVSLTRVVISDPSRFMPRMIVSIKGATHRIQSIVRDTLMLEPPLMHALTTGARVKILTHTETTARNGSAAEIPLQNPERFPPGSYIQIGSQTIPRLVTALDYTQRSAAFFPPLSAHAPIGTRIQLWPAYKAVRDGAKDSVHVASPYQFTVGDKIEIGNDGVMRIVRDIRGSSLAFAPPRKQPTRIGDNIATWAPSPAIDLHLAQGSPCIDAGESAIAGRRDLHGDMLYQDFHGLPRFDNPDAENGGSGDIPFVDRGAYEAVFGAKIDLSAYQDQSRFQALGAKQRIDFDPLHTASSKKMPEAQITVWLTDLLKSSGGHAAIHKKKAARLLHALKQAARLNTYVYVDLELYSSPWDTALGTEKRNLPSYVAVANDSAACAALHACLKDIFHKSKQLLNGDDVIIRLSARPHTKTGGSAAMQAHENAYLLIYDIVIDALRCAGIERVVQPGIFSPDGAFPDDSWFRTLAAFLASDTLLKKHQQVLPLKKAVHSKSRCRLLSDAPLWFSIQAASHTPDYRNRTQRALPVSAANIRAMTTPVIRTNKRLNGVSIGIFAEDFPRQAPANHTAGDARQRHAAIDAARAAALYRNAAGCRLERYILWNGLKFDSIRSDCFGIRRAVSLFPFMRSLSPVPITCAGSMTSVMSAVDGFAASDSRAGEHYLVLYHVHNNVAASDVQQVVIDCAGLMPTSDYIVLGKNASRHEEPVAVSALKDEFIATVKDRDGMHKTALSPHGSSRMRSNAAGSMQLTVGVPANSAIMISIQLIRAGKAPNVASKQQQAE